MTCSALSSSPTQRASLECAGVEKPSHPVRNRKSVLREKRENTEQQRLVKKKNHHFLNRNPLRGHCWTGSNF